jgi:hypothetical protein
MAATEINETSNKQNNFSNELIENLKAQISERDKQIEGLKTFKGNLDELNSKIEELKRENAEKSKKFDEEIKTERLKNAVKLELAGKVHDPDLMFSQLDMNKITTAENGEISGLTEQLESLKETKSFLFVNSDPGPPKIIGKEPESGGIRGFAAQKPAEKSSGSIGKNFAESRAKENQACKLINEKFFG